MSIDNITPEEWNKLTFKTFEYDKPRVPTETHVDDAWNYFYVDNEPNHHSRFSEEATSKTYDVVDRPEHYTNGSMECIEAIEGMLTHEEYIGYLRGTAFAYMWRFRDKGKPIEDIRKAGWHEKRLINYLLEHPGDKLG